MVGGVAGFVGAAIVGARHGKEKDPAKKLVLETHPSFKNWLKEIPD